MAHRFHKGRDGWGRDSYEIPQYAVVGASDTGTYPDSPAHSVKVEAELERFRADLASDKQIGSEIDQYTNSGNVFMVKRWVTVAEEDFAAAAEYALEWLKQHKGDTTWIHDADLEQTAPPQEVGAS